MWQGAWKVLLIVTGPGALEIGSISWIGWYKPSLVKTLSIGSREVE